MLLLNWRRFYYMLLLGIVEISLESTVIYHLMHCVSHFFFRTIQRKGTWSNYWQCSDSRLGGRNSISDITTFPYTSLPSRAFRYTVLATMFSNSISSSLTVYDHLGPVLTLSHSSQDATQGGVLRGNMARTPRMPTLPMFLRSTSRLTGSLCSLLSAVPTQK